MGLGEAFGAGNRGCKLGLGSFSLPVEGSSGSFFALRTRSGIPSRLTEAANWIFREAAISAAASGCWG